MEPISETLKRVVNAPAFSERYKEMRKEVLAHAGVQKFLEDHAEEIDAATIDRGLGKLYEYIDQSHDCNKCPSLDVCINHLKGFEPNLVLERGTVGISYTKCRLKEASDNKRHASSLIHSMYMPKEVMQATLDGFDLDDSRMEAFRAVGDFLDQATGPDNLPEKGLYLYGQFGIGKSYLLSAVANELAEINVKSVLVFVPEFMREMKQAIGDQTLQEKVDYVKKADVLMLDDIGAEAMSSWTRDEVLGTILHYRMSEKLPTFMSSNFSYSELEYHLTYSQRGEKEDLKAARIMERIRALTNSVKLDGRNRRN
ncbi:primosomal protein DnaI [Planococcus antarcticus DSM 14505]|uniref:Primosomal protein DnaI n=1 Tax=Planococcus antarcticus DSM 14505 TaxID=1185653 RepID=A0A1C7DIQ3_9BACL|nr:primosomal protein DnaI [Planococcus antarcticus]ANU11376.1 primosomal protein DnaI [Planococcus antarcticus DSM 14505]EIM05481.1 primosomal protein DnaI [Planococcus antarcticus DSM 14505]